MKVLQKKSTPCENDHQNYTPYKTFPLTMQFWNSQFSFHLCSSSITIFNLGFSLNGELMMDRMGQEIAFKGIETSEPFVAVISLGPDQRARLNFGQVNLVCCSVNI